MTMFSTREVPWGKLGQLIAEPVDAARAAELGGLDFEVVLRPLQYQLADGTWLGADKRRAVVRQDTEDFFEVVSSSYSPLQYREAFDFLDEISPRYVAAGTIKDGRQGFMVIQLPEAAGARLQLEDPHEVYVLVRTSHDRSRGIECAVLPLRGKCMNSIGLASLTANAPQRWSVTHIGDVVGKLHNATTLVDQTTRYLEAYERRVEQLASITLTSEQADKVLRSVIRVMPSQGEVVAQIQHMWRDDETIALGSTGWGLVNAVSSYFEWHRVGGSAQSQLLGVLEGQTKKAIDKTAQLVLQLA